MRLFSLRWILCAAVVSFVLSAVSVWADSAFTVTDVHVDASATSAAGARNAAIAAGRVQAWQTLFRRITRQQDWARQPELTPEQLQRYITSYLPAGEKRSTTRYVADVTYNFNREAVARLLQSVKIAYAAAQAKRVLVIPMAPGYARWSSWSAALANPRLSGGLVPFAVPFGDAQDLTVLNGLNFETANWSEVSAVAARRGATEAVLILAEPEGDKMALSLRRLGPNQVPVKAAAEVGMLQGGAASTYALAAETAIRAMEDLWKTHAAVDFSRKGKLVAEVRLISLDRFVALQNQLAAVPTLSEVNVVAMNTGVARLSLTYQGTVEQFQEMLSQAGFHLTKLDDGWLLSRSHAAAAANAGATP